jgi:hypothetical protein
MRGGGAYRFAASLFVLVMACALVLARPEFALALSPALALALLIVNGLFPAEEAIERLRSRLAARPVVETSRAPSRSRPVRPARCRRQLIAFALANRPPPGLVPGA